MAGTLGSMALQAASGVSVSGGTATSLTGLSIRSTGAAFNLTFATSEVLTANRTLSLIVGDAARTLTIFGSTTIPVATQQLTFAGPTAARTITFPDAAITVARTDAAQSFTGIQTFDSAIRQANGSNTVPTYGFTSGTNTGMYRGSSGELRFTQGGTSWVCIDSGGIYVGGGGASSRGIGFSGTSDPYTATDFYLNRTAANTLTIQDANTSGMTVRIAGDGNTNTKYLQLAHNGTNATISATSGNLHISSLPTSNPGPGILWNSGGVPAIGT